MNAPNAKTAAAARTQAPIVAVNVIAQLKGEKTSASTTAMAHVHLR